MILRDAIFSGERRHLGAQPAPPPALEPQVREMPADYAAALVQAPLDDSPHAPEPPPLSSDFVASWLVTQDGATRTALAAVLSDDLAAVRDAAHEEGYERGHAAAMKEAREKVQSAVDALGKVSAAAEGAFAAELEQLQSACVDVVSEAFFKLAGAALVSREAIVGVVSEVLKRVREERELRIHVNPADLPVLRSAEPAIAARIPGRRYTFVADARVAAGGCIVESALGSLDGRLEVQLGELVATLRAARTGSEP